MTLVLRYAARSDRGLVRANNEDSVYAGARLLALADGMGGHAAGEVASQLVIAALAHLDDDEPGGDLLSKLNAAVHEGNSAIAAHVEADPELEGMGTTLTAILFAGNRLGLVHIGDSRGYLLRDGELTQITKDDTFVQTLVDEGRITAEEAHSHPQRSLIMRALTGHEVEPTLIVREAHAGDRYLLCSDGLSDPVSHDTILEALQIADVTESADRLIELALRGGGPDNVTVVVADVVDYDYGQTQPILAGAVSGDDDQSAPPNTAAGRASAFNPKRAPRAKRVVAAARRAAAASRGRGARMIIAARAAPAAGAAPDSPSAARSFATTTTSPSTTAPSTIMRGVQGSLLGNAAAGAVPARLPRTPATSSRSSAPTSTRSGCQLLKVDDLRESERAQVTAGLPVRHARRRHPPAQRARPGLGAADLRAARDPADRRRRPPHRRLPRRLAPDPRPPARHRATPTDSAPHRRRRHPRPPPGAGSRAPPTARRRRPADADRHRAAAAATGAGHQLPGRRHDAPQPQAPVTVVPPLPNRRNAELFLLGFAARHHHGRAAASSRPTRNRASAGTSPQYTRRATSRCSAARTWPSAASRRTPIRCCFRWSRC